MDTPGHVQMWYKYYFPDDDNDTINSNKRISKPDDAMLDKILDDMAIRGFNATTDAPACYTYLQQMKKYPNAKVVLTVRSDGEKWAKSFVNSIYTVQILLQYAPFRWISGFHMFEQLHQAMSKEHLDVDIDPITGHVVLDIDQLSHAYESWIEKVCVI